MNTYIALLIGLACAGGGGELFVKGTVGLAKAARISPGIIAATVAAFATSSPELTIAISSALEKKPEISLGDALGSNVVNVVLILALALLIAPICARRNSTRAIFPWHFCSLSSLQSCSWTASYPGSTGCSCWSFLLFGSESVIREARTERSAAAEVLGEMRPLRAFAVCGAGLLLLVAAGKFIVFGATGAAKSFGLSEFIIVLAARPTL